MTDNTHLPRLAVVDRNTLSCIGMQAILEEVIPMGVVRVFSSLEELTCDAPESYAHYFISSQIYFENTSFFLPRMPKTIVMVGGDNHPQLKGIPTLNVFQDERGLIRDIIALQHYGHELSGIAHHHDSPPINVRNELSARETEVLVLITKGLINKEIADRLNIGLTTVISHRKNITRKLGMKSVSALTIYAVLNGYIEAERV